MPTKANERKKRRFEKTRRDFERWYAKHPDADLKRQVEAFNSIADSNFRESREPQAKRIAKKAIKQI